MKLAAQLARIRGGAYDAASYQNQPNDRGGRWIENPGAAGLRFVGFSDEIAGRGIDHKGWFLNSFDQDEVARGAVYQLPARGGRPVYVEALRTGSTDKAGDWQDMGDQGGALIFLQERHIGEPGGTSDCPGRKYLSDYADSTMREAARGADQEAEFSAEKERDYQEATSAGFQATELLQESAECKASARDLIRELRKVRQTIPANLAPLSCRALRSDIKGLLRRCAKLRDESRALVNQWAGNDAFAESYGESVA